jgi:hypothetical protein
MNAVGKCDIENVDLKVYKCYALYKFGKSNASDVLIKTNMHCKFSMIDMRID